MRPFDLQESQYGLSSNKWAQHTLDDRFTPREGLAKAGGDQKSEKQVTAGSSIYAKGEHCRLHCGADDTLRLARKELSDSEKQVC